MPNSNSMRRIRIDAKKRVNAVKISKFLRTLLLRFSKMTRFTIRFHVLLARVAAGRRAFNKPRRARRTHLVVTRHELIRFCSSYQPRSGRSGLKNPNSLFGSFGYFGIERKANCRNGCRALACKRREDERKGGEGSEKLSFNAMYIYIRLYDLKNEIETKFMVYIST